MQSTFFDQQLSRLKKVLEVREDQEAATALGMTKAAFSARKTRGSFPEKELRALAQQRPELGIDVEYVLTGGRLTQRERDHLESARALTLGLPMDEGDRQRLLAQLEDGFVLLATQNAARQHDYMRLMESLNSCTDESLRLVLLVAEQCRLADLHRSTNERGKAA